MLGYKTKLLKVMKGAKARYIFKEKELAELLDSGILVKMYDSDTKEYIIRIKPSKRHELLKIKKESQTNA
jgi:hypothetical protein